MAMVQELHSKGDVELAQHPTPRFNSRVFCFYEFELSLEILY
jgi:hypothetical protein